MGEFMHNSIVRQKGRHRNQDCEQAKQASNSPLLQQFYSGPILCPLLCGQSRFGCILFSFLFGAALSFGDFFVF